MTIVDFLNARLDEDERTARAASDDLGHVMGQIEYTDHEVEADWRYIAHHDPARTLREIEAKRRILGQFEAYMEANDWDWKYFGSDIRDEYADGVRETIWDSVRHLAAVYADHPDYDAEKWAP